MTIIMVPWRVKRKIDRIQRGNDWRIIADNLKKAGWSWGCVSTVDYEGRKVWIVEAHRDDGKRYIVQAYERLTAFSELKHAAHQS